MPLLLHMLMLPCMLLLGFAGSTLGAADVAMSETLPPSRPILILNHNPKAGGGTLIGLLNETFPCQLKKSAVQNQPIGTQYTVDCCKLGSPHFIDSFNFNRTKYFKGCHTGGCDLRLSSRGTALPPGLSQEPTQPKVNNSSCWVRITEFESSGLKQQMRGFIISSIREPCSHFLSLWSYSSASRHGQFGSGHKEIRHLLGKDEPFYNSSADIARFQEWMLTKPVSGLMMKRYTKSFLSKHQNPKHAEIKERVDCWVFVEDFESTLVNCLRKFEEQGGTVNWEAPKLKNILAHISAPKNAVVAIYKRGNTKKNDNHGHCLSYFDAKTARMVEGGPEAYIYRKFGYSSCCNKELSTANKLPERL